MSCEKAVAKEKTQEPSLLWNPKKKKKVKKIGLRRFFPDQGVRWLVWQHEVLR